MINCSPKEYDVVYVVDDSKTLRLAHHQLLKRIVENTTIKNFPNAGYALNSLKKEVDLGKRVLIFLDIEMPELTGIEALNYLHCSPYFSPENIHIIFVSSGLEHYLDNFLLRSYFVKGCIKKPLTLGKINYLSENQSNANSLEVA